MMFENDFYIAMELVSVLWTHRAGPARILAGPQGSPQGHDFIKWYLFGLFVFPVALIASFMIKDERDDNEGNG